MWSSDFAQAQTLLQGNPQSEEALTFLHRALNQASQNDGKEELFAVLQTFIRFYQQKGDYEECIHYSFELLEKEKKYWGNDNPEVATTLFNIASLFVEMENLEKAKETFLDSLRIDLKHNKEPHITLGIVYQQLAIVSFEMQDLFAAEDYFLKAKKNIKPFLPNGLNEYCSILYNFSILKNVIEELDEALLLLKEYLDCTALYSERLEDQEEKIYLAFLLQGNLYLEKNDWPLALSAYQKCLDFQEVEELRVWKKEWIELYNNLGFASRKVKEYEKSHLYYTKALDKSIAEYEVVSLEVADILFNCSFLYAEEEDWSKAIKMCRQSLQIRLQLLSNLHVDVLDTKKHLSSLFFYQGDMEAAQKIMEDVIESSSKMDGLISSD